MSPDPIKGKGGLAPHPEWARVEPKLHPDAPAAEEYAENRVPEDADIIADLAAGRKLLGLASDLNLTRRLASTPGAGDQIREFGTVLTSDEHQRFKKASTAQRELGLLVDELWNVPGYAGLLADWGGEGRTELRSVTVQLASRSETGVETVRKFADARGFDVDIVAVKASWSELAAAAQVLADESPARNRVSPAVGVPGARDLASKRSFRAEVLGNLPADLISDLRSGAAMPVGYSVAQNALMVDLGETAVASRSIPSEGLRVITAPLDRGEEELICEKRGCNATRVGVEIEHAGSNVWCTLGLPVARSGDESYVTAGHCNGWGSHDAQFQRPSSFALSRWVDRRLGSTGNRLYGPNHDIKRLVVDDRLVTNRLRGLNGAGQRINGTQLPSQGMIGDPICKSGATTDITCGVVLDIGQTVSLSGTQTTDMVSADYIAESGDSGSPIYQKFNNGIVLGIHRGGDGPEYFTSVTALPALQAGLWVYTTTNYPKDFLLGLYEAALGRFADPGGFDWHLNNIDNGCNASNLDSQRSTVYAFYTSTEFANRFPLDSDVRRRIAVKAVYQGVLQRDPSWDETAYWADVAANNWADVPYNLAWSGEFNSRFWGISGAAYDGRTC